MKTASVGCYFYRIGWEVRLQPRPGSPELVCCSSWIPFSSTSLRMMLPVGRLAVLVVGPQRRLTCLWSGLTMLSARSRSSLSWEAALANNEVTSLHRGTLTSHHTLGPFRFSASYSACPDAEPSRYFSMIVRSSAGCSASAPEEPSLVI